MPTSPSDTKGPRRLRVVSFESRRSQEMAELIRESGGQALIAPSLREVPLRENQEALSFAKKLLAGPARARIPLDAPGKYGTFETRASSRNRRAGRHRPFHQFESNPAGPPVCSRRGAGKRLSRGAQPIGRGLRRARLHGISR